MPTIRLIATDLDGTLVGAADEFPIHEAFRRQLEHLRAKHGAAWVVCTGRALKGFLRFLAPLEALGIAPEYVIVHHAYIYRHTRVGYRPHVTWNLWIWMHLLIGRLHLRSAINEWHKLIVGANHNVTTIYRRRNRLCLRFVSKKDAEEAARVLTEKAHAFRHLRVFHYLHEVDVRQVPFTKGLALHDLAAHLGVPRDEILAIGNGHNDISMLDGRVARFTGCPGNAESAVMEVVHQTGGHIARSHCLAGVVQILNAYLENTVDSSLPEHWTPSACAPNPHTKGWSNRQPHQHSAGQVRRERTSFWFFLAVCYAVLLVFASFDIIPFSQAVMRPYVWMGGILQRLMEWMGGTG
jgi:HAD superfamily hydrolase (TIGR01484 family)